MERPEPRVVGHEAEHHPVVRGDEDRGAAAREQSDGGGKRDMGEGVRTEAGSSRSAAGRRIGLRLRPCLT